MDIGPVELMVLLFPGMRADPQSATDDSVVSRLDELASLRESGALTQEEFESAKSKLLGA